MYSSAESEKQLEAALPAAKEQWQRLSGRRDFAFQRRSLDEVVFYNKHFESLIDGVGKLKRALSLEEQRWIINERALCRWDFRYYLGRYYQILHWGGQQMVMLDPNVAQSIVLATWAEREEAQASISQMVLKARQVGITTLVQAAVAHRVQFHPNVRAVVGSSRPEKSRTMVDKALVSWNLQPWYLRPRMTSYRAGELIDFGAQNSSVNIQHGAKVQSGIARGETPSMAHLSEVSEYANPRRDVESALVLAMHRSPNMFLVLESTAHGMAGWWYEKWQEAKSFWGDLNTPSDLQPVFLGWYVARDLYPTETWLRENPVPERWKPSEHTKRHAAKAEAFVRRDALHTKHLGSTWGMSLEQQWWWESTRAQYERTNQLNVFYQELPADDVEAFQHEGTAVFSSELVMTYNDHTEVPKAVYGLEGPVDEIRPELQPDRREVNPNLKPVKIEGQRESGVKFSYRLVPLRLDGYPIHFSPVGKILMWEMPADDVEYGLGIDTAQGIGLDRSVVEVIRKATTMTVARQVAEFASQWVNASDLFPYAHALAKLYSRRFQGEVKQPYIVVETNNGGDACQLALRKAGWGRMHQWIRYDKKVIDASKANFVGAVTTTWSRDLVVGHLVKALRDGLIDIDSPWFIREMQTLQKDETKMRIAAAANSHDDRFMALGWIYLAMHILEFGELKSAFGKGRILRDDEVAEEKVMEQRPPAPEELPVADYTVDKLIAGQGLAYGDYGMDSAWVPKWGR